MGILDSIKKKLNQKDKTGSEEDLEERRERRRQYSQEYYTGRVTPYHIDKLEPNEIFVFGSNPAGIHAGGAARIALDKFGAEWKNGEGIQGQSYAIPTTDGMQLMKEAVEDFISFAKEHPEYRFLVTRIGCGISGYQPSAVAPLFKDAIELENVTLPKDFWEVLGLKML